MCARGELRGAKSVLGAAPDIDVVMRLARSAKLGRVHAIVLRFVIGVRVVPYAERTRPSFEASSFEARRAFIRL
jgi:hypothetical protein